MRLLLPLLLTVVIAPLGSVVLAGDYALGLVAFDRGDIATAEREFSALAGEGHPQAQYSLAMLYLKSAPPDYARAIPWLEQSARSGLAESQYMLGMLTLYGVGTPKDARRGLRLLESASAQGDDNARVALEQIEKARLRAAESAERKARQAQTMRGELDKARAEERALRKRLAQSRQREKTLASERDSLRKARASEAREKEALERKRLELERELDALRAQLAQAERSRAELESAMQTAAADDAPSAIDKPAELKREPAELKPGEARVAGTVVEVLPDGVVLGEVSQQFRGRSEPLSDGLVVFVNVTSTEGLSKGQEVSYVAEPATPYRYRYESGATGRIRAFRALSE